MPCRRKNWRRCRRFAARCAKRWTASKADHAFLKKGGVFSEDFIESLYRAEDEEVYAFEHTPHPIEFKMYYSV